MNVCFINCNKNFRNRENLQKREGVLLTKSLISPLSIAVEKSKWHQMLLFGHFNNELLSSYHKIYELLSCCHVYIPQNI